jgi:N-acetylmuramoyl-L-alanine amidase
MKQRGSGAKLLGAVSGTRLARSLIALAALAVAACAPLSPLPPRAGVPVEVRPSPNFDERRPNFVILHHTSDDDTDEALVTLTDPARKVSSHYLIGRDGKIYYLVDELARAWHAGESYWGGDTDLNSASIGIELDNNGEEPFAEAEIEALLALLADLKERYAIPAANFLGHGDIAPGRKVDPSRWFPWQRLAAGGFGLWCDAPLEPVPATVSDAILLGALGYDTANLDAAIGAFKRHFAPDDTSPELTEHDRSFLQCLVAQKTGGADR